MSRHGNDIKAPDGYLLGGHRLVRPNSTIFFGRSWWKAPADWIGEVVEVHNLDADGNFHQIEAAPPGVGIYAARMNEQAVTLENAGRPDAKTGRRTRP